MTGLTLTQHNIIVVLMIPPLIAITGAKALFLPPGIHLASLTEVEETFAFNSHRKYLFTGLTKVTSELHRAGCKTIFFDGSFISSKPFPADYDGCWDPTGVDLSRIDPVLLDFANHRSAQKAKYLGEMFPATTREISGKTFLDFFQTDRSTGTAKGIIQLQDSKANP